MRRLIRHSVLCLVAVLGAPLVHAQSTTCETAQFSQQVIERFPQVRDGCLDIIERGGQQYAVFRANLVRTSQNTLYVRFKRADGTRGETRAVKVQPGFRVLINGEPTRPEDLAVGQELTAYVKVTEPMMALEPATETEPLELAPLESTSARLAEADTPAMPRTGSRLPELGLLGGAMLGLAATLSWLRTRRRRREAG